MKFHAQIYVEVDRVGEQLITDPENKLPPLLVTINDLFSTLEASIGHLHATRQVLTNKESSCIVFSFYFHLYVFLHASYLSEPCFVKANLNWCLFPELTFSTFQSDSSVDGTYSTPLLFEKLPEINHEGSQWTDCEIRDAINSVYQNLDKLESYICFLVRASVLCINFL